MYWVGFMTGIFIGACIGGTVIGWIASGVIADREEMIDLIIDKYEGP